LRASVSTQRGEKRDGGCHDTVLTALLENRSAMLAEIEALGASWPTWQGCGQERNHLHPVMGVHRIACDDQLASQRIERRRHS
jgi:hypothetical protein